MTSRLETTRPTTLDAYLRRATWGLPEGRRQELWGELEEHVLTRAEHLQLTGLSPTQAQAQALRELGPPARVTLGMAKVYAMPKLLFAAGTLALALSAGLYALAGGARGGVINLSILTSRPITPVCVKGATPVDPQISIISQNNGTTCYVFKDQGTYAGVYLRRDDVARVLAANGVESTPVRSSPAGALDLKFTDGSSAPLWSNFQREGQFYTDANYVLQTTLGTPLASSTRLNGYDNPLLTLGTTTLALGSGSQPLAGRVFYANITPFLATALLNSDPLHQPSPSWGQPRREAEKLRLPVTHSVQTGLAKSEVVMAVLKRSRTSYLIDIAPVEADGSVNLILGKVDLRFVTSLSQLNSQSTDGRTPAVLVRVTNISLNQLNTGIIRPAQATSDAR